MSMDVMTPATAPVALERDIFCRTLIRELAGVLEETVGLEDASGYISLVGRKIGEWIEGEYKEALGVAVLSEEQVAQVLLDLKSRINGTFELESHDEQRMVFVNGRCPFEESVLGRESMCMMTANVFGSITARNLGYAKVELDETIARGDGRCRVLVHLDADSDQSRDAEGYEYFGED